MNNVFQHILTAGKLIETFLHFINFQTFSLVFIEKIFFVNRFSDSMCNQASKFEQFFLFLHMKIRQFEWIFQIKIVNDRVYLIYFVFIIIIDIFLCKQFVRVNIK